MKKLQVLWLTLINLFGYLGRRKIKKEWSFKNSAELKPVMFKEVMEWLLLETETQGEILRTYLELNELSKLSPRIKVFNGQSQTEFFETFAFIPRVLNYTKNPFVSGLKLMVILKDVHWEEYNKKVSVAAVKDDLYTAGNYHSADGRLLKDILNDDEDVAFIDDLHTRFEESLISLAMAELHVEKEKEE